MFVYIGAPKKILRGCVTVLPMFRLFSGAESPSLIQQLLRILTMLTAGVGRPIADGWNAESSSRLGPKKLAIDSSSAKMELEFRLHNFTSVCRRFSTYCNISEELLDILEAGDKVLNTMRPEVRQYLLLATLVLGFCLASLVLLIQSHQTKTVFGFGLCNLINDALQIVNVVQEYLLHAGIALLFGKDYFLILILQYLFRTDSFMTMLMVLLLLTIGSQGFNEALQMLDRYLNVAPDDIDHRVVVVPTAFRRHLLYIWNLIHGIFWYIWTCLPGRRDQLLLTDWLIGYTGQDQPTFPINFLFFN
jgi:hypothetical protein